MIYRCPIVFEDQFGDLMDLSHPTHKPLQPGQQVSTSGEILEFAARTYGRKTGLIDGSRSWTFGELDDVANQFAHALIKRFADLEGPVGIIGKNTVEYAIAHFGTARSGRYSVNLPTRCTAEDLVYAVNLTKPVVLIVDADCQDIVARARGQFEISPLCIPTDPEQRATEACFWEFFANQPKTIPNITIDPDASGSVVFTGGTTGRPKAVLSSQRARAVSAMAAIEDFRIESDLVAGYTVPFTHTAGLFSWFQPAVLAGCTGVVIPKWTPGLFMQLVERHRINMIFAVPAQLATLLAEPGFEAERLRSLRRIVFGAAPLSRGLIERAAEAMPWMECVRGYGSSETGHLAVQVGDDRDIIFDGYNQPGGRLEIEIFKEPGAVAGVGEIGEVATRGPHLMTGYLHDEAAQSDFFKADMTDGQWGWTGDLAIRHNGYFSLAGRSKHMILSGGLNIFPAELEDVLSRHPDVADCTVFGIDDQVWGELPVAAIVVTAGSSIDEGAVLEYVAERVARYKRLRKIYVIDEIPRTAAGKAQVFVVKKRCRQIDDTRLLDI